MKTFDRHSPNNICLHKIEKLYKTSLITSIQTLKKSTFCMPTQHANYSTLKAAAEQRNHEMGTQLPRGKCSPEKALHLLNLISFHGLYCKLHLSTVWSSTGALHCLCTLCCLDHSCCLGHLLNCFLLEGGTFGS